MDGTITFTVEDGMVYMKPEDYTLLSLLIMYSNSKHIKVTNEEEAEEN